VKRQFVVSAASLGLLLLSCVGCTKPTANFHADVTEGTPPLAVQFTDDSVDGSDAITSWAWDFGDQQTSALPNPGHTYTATGTYSVSLTVESKRGSSTRTRTNYITVEIPKIAYITVGVAEGPLGGTVELPIFLDDGNSEPCTIVLDLEYDPAKLEFVSAGTTGTAAAAGKHIAAYTPACGATRFVISEINDTAIASGEIFRATFNAIAALPADSLQITAANVSIADPAAKKITPVTTSGDVSITAAGEGEGEGEAPAPGESRTFAGIEFVWIPAGSFEMGSIKTADELSALYGDSATLFLPEHPQHHVAITNGFWLGKYEVTQAQWAALMESNPSFDVGDTLPVERVSWCDCQEFIHLLNETGEGRFRLPTEAEWEYACRAGSTSEFYYGNDVVSFGQYGWSLENALGGTQAVGGRLPNAWNLFDMMGNVDEWCLDWYSDSYYAESPSADPVGPDSGEQRVHRGGNYDSTPGLCRPAYRASAAQDSSGPVTGLRIIRVP